MEVLAVAFVDRPWSTIRLRSGRRGGFGARGAYRPPVESVVQSPVPSRPSGRCDGWSAGPPAPCEPGRAGRLGVDRAVEVDGLASRSTASHGAVGVVEQEDRQPCRSRGGPGAGQARIEHLVRSSEAGRVWANRCRLNNRALASVSRLIRSMAGRGSAVGLAARCAGRSRRRPRSTAAAPIHWIASSASRAVPDSISVKAKPTIGRGRGGGTMRRARPKPRANPAVMTRTAAEVNTSGDCQEPVADQGEPNSRPRPAVWPGSAVTRCRSGGRVAGGRVASEHGDQPRRWSSRSPWRAGRGEDQRHGDRGQPDVEDGGVGTGPDGRRVGRPGRRRSPAGGTRIPQSRLLRDSGGAPVLRRGLGLGAVGRQGRGGAADGRPRRGRRSRHSGPGDGRVLGSAGRLRSVPSALGPPMLGRRPAGCRRPAGLATVVRTCCLVG